MHCTQGGTPPGEPLPINIAPVPIPDGVPTNSEVRDLVGELMNVRRGGASKMHAETSRSGPRGYKRRKTQSNSIAIRELEMHGASS